MSAPAVPNLPPPSLTRAQQPDDCDEPGQDGGDRQREDVEEVAGPIGRRRLTDDGHAGDRPQPTAQEGGRSRDARSGVESRVERSAGEVQPGPTAEVGLLEDRDHLGLVALAPCPRVEPEQARTRTAAAARSSAATPRNEGWENSRLPERDRQRPEDHV